MISVIVPVYNVEGFIERCIKSLINQTFNDFEVIIVDDGSSDNSISIAMKLITNDKRFTVVRKTNGGLSSARNYGVKYSKGDLISFLDSDDYFEVDFLQKMYDSLIENNADISICQLCLVEEDGTFIENRGKFTNKKLSGYDAFIDNLSGKSITSGAQNKLYKRHLIEKYPYPEGLLYEDRATTYKMFLDSKNISFVNEPLFFYVQRKGSIMNSFSSRKMEDRFVVFDSIVNELKKRSIYDSVINEIGVCFLLNVLLSGAMQISKFTKSSQNNLLELLIRSEEYINIIPEYSFVLLRKQNLVKYLMVVLFIKSPKIFDFIIKIKYKKMS